MTGKRINSARINAGWTRAGLLALATAAAGCATNGAAGPMTAQSALQPYYDQLGEPMSVAPAGPALSAERRLTRVAFGSCLEETKPAPILSTVRSLDPDLMVMLGDNVYGDMEGGDVSLRELRKAYADLAANPDFAALAQETPIEAVWDDHDYGLNDAGARFAGKDFSQRLFNEFWRVPAADPRRSRPGTYASSVYGPEGQEVRLILLDTRYFRDDPLASDERNAPGKERYMPDPDASKTVLGADQWAWLEAELARPAAVTILASSIQVLADGHGWEAWRLFPAERERLFALLDAHASQSLVILSGDRHRAGVYRRDPGAGRSAIYEVTASSLNLPGVAWGAVEEPGPNRLGPTYLEENFGLLEIDWESRTLSLSVRDLEGRAVLSQSVTLDAPNTN